MNRVHLDLAWGRSRHRRGTQEELALGDSVCVEPQQRVLQTSIKLYRRCWWIFQYSPANRALPRESVSSSILHGQWGQRMCLA